MRLGRSCYYGKANVVLSYLADLAQSLIAVGALAWCVWAWRRRDRVGAQEVLALTYVLGAALLHVFWENKTQYILPYYVLMIPHAACGWGCWARRWVVRLASARLRLVADSGVAKDGVTDIS